MTFDAWEITIRQIANGISSMGAMLLFVVFARYLWRNRRVWKTSASVQAAAAITVLTFGHWLRSTNSWAEFHFLQDGLDPVWWAPWTWVIFLVSAFFVVLGKTGMIYTFSPDRWRLWFIGIGIPVCVVVPVLVAVFL